MRKSLLLVAAMLVLAPGAAVKAVDASAVHVRCLNGRATELLGRATERSPMVRDLVDSLERSDVIVYVEAVTSAAMLEFKGALRFVAFTGGQRYLLVQVDAFATSPANQVGLLGHELFHATEVAREPGIRDTTAFKAYYERIGTKWGTDRFETVGARRTEELVRADVAAYRGHPRS